MPNLREAVGKETANDLLCTIHHVPVGDDSSLFITLIPDGTHDQESWLANSLKYTEESPNYDEGWEAEAKSMAAKNRGPTHDVDSKEFCYGNSLDREVDGVFDDENGDVDTSGEPPPLKDVSCNSRQLYAINGNPRSSSASILGYHYGYP
jgi:hypothetical protein